MCLDVADHLEHVGKEFTGLRTVAKIHATREHNGKTEEQMRYFISSLPCKAEQIAKSEPLPVEEANYVQFLTDTIKNHDRTKQ